MRMKKLGRFLTAGLASVLLCAPCLSASAALDDWMTVRGLGEVSGSDSEGYRISSTSGNIGNGGATLFVYDKPMDIFRTEISFHYEAWPNNEADQEAWAYIHFSTSNEDTAMLDSAENNLAMGRIELIFHRFKDGTLQISVWNGGETQLLTQNAFDFTQTITLRLVEKNGAVYLAYNGAPLGAMDFRDYVEPYTGDDAKKTYVHVGGQQGFDIQNLKIEDKDPPTTSSRPSSTGTTSITKLHPKTTTAGETETTTPDVSTGTAVEDGGLPLAAVIGIAAGAVVVAAAIVVIVVVAVKKKKGTPKA